MLYNFKQSSSLETALHIATWFIVYLEMSESWYKNWQYKRFQCIFPTHDLKFATSISRGNPDEIPYNH